jgi:hypothetical protein
MAMRACKGLTVAWKPRYTALVAQMTTKDPQERTCGRYAAFVADYGVGSEDEGQRAEANAPRCSYMIQRSIDE